jgi:hypothetical protein
MMNAHDCTARLVDLLSREHSALADFLVVLADFDRRRLWEELGHPSLFSFLHRQLGLSKGAAFYRKVAADLVGRFPEVIEPLRDGRLCITSVVVFAKVLTPENRAEVLPRFFHRSKQEAKAISAELRPNEAPPRRDVVTATSPAPRLIDAVAGSRADAQPTVVAVQPVEPVHANTPGPSWAARAQPVEPPRSAPRDTAEPVTGDLRRLHVTVSRRFLEKLDAARDALSHARPGATTEDVLDAALDLLLAQRAKRRAAEVKRPRPASAPTSSTSPRHVPASVRREVWARDEGRCQWKIESGGVCGSAHRLELDHIVPVARGGPSSAANLRILCGAHNRLAARRVFGERYIEQFTGL